MIRYEEKMKNGEKPKYKDIEKKMKKEKEKQNQKMSMEKWRKEKNKIQRYEEIMNKREKIYRNMKKKF